VSRPTSASSAPAGFRSSRGRTTRPRPPCVTTGPVERRRTGRSSSPGRWRGAAGRAASRSPPTGPPPSGTRSTRTSNSPRPGTSTRSSSPRRRSPTRLTTNGCRTRSSCRRVRRNPVPVRRRGRRTEQLHRGDTDDPVLPRDRDGRRPPSGRRPRHGTGGHHGCGPEPQSGRLPVGDRRPRHAPGRLGSTHDLQRRAERRTRLHRGSQRAVAGTGGDRRGHARPDPVLPDRLRHRVQPERWRGITDDRVRRRLRPVSPVPPAPVARPG